ncbi:MAG TPA: hypothetical protein VJC16_06375 [Candidatus Nanoarchaeia archaeon]|nr:hypothetical protein [Candidatus Nanoarchaeia archaeon]
MRNKGYYLMLDALVAAVILVIGYFLVAGNFLDTEQDALAKHAATEIMELLATTSFPELCTPLCSPSSLQPAYDALRNKNLTLLEAIGELYARDTDGSSISLARQMVEAVVVSPGLVPQTANFSLTLQDGPSSTLIYPVISPYTGHLRGVFPEKKVVFGSYRGSVVYWGPYTVTLSVWENTPIPLCDPSLPSSHEEKCGKNMLCFRHDLRQGFPFEQAGVCIFSKGEPGQPCNLNSQCKKGSFCSGTDQVCFDKYQGKPCQKEADCGAGFVCEADECIPTDGLPGDRCGFDNDCTLASCTVISHPDYDAPAGFCFASYCKFAEDACAADADCSPGYRCTAGSCTNTCASMFVCGAGSVCQLDAELPSYRACTDTLGISGAACELDNDCQGGLACIQGSCMLQQPKPEGSSCANAAACGADSVCIVGSCRATTLELPRRCDSDTDCNAGYACLQFNNVESRCYPTNTCTSNTCTNDATGKFSCGPGYYCDISQGLCRSTKGNAGQPCDFASDCAAGMNCLLSACIPEAEDAPRCGDGTIDLNEQCEPDLNPTTTCGALGCTASQAEIVTCNPPGSIAPCRWDRQNCEPESCPACRFPADCNEDCQIAAEELNTLLSQRRIFTVYDCKQGCPVIPIGQLMSCSFDLATDQGIPLQAGRYPDPYTLETACPQEIIPECFTIP